MRKFILAAAIAALGAAVVASPAFAFDHHFSVKAKETAIHPAGQNAFRFKDRLLDPNNRHDKVGRDHGKCRQKSQRRIKCRIRVHLNGEIGGFGDIRVRGDLQPGDGHLVVLGGSDQFDGVAGKLTIHELRERVFKYHFDLVR
jgi:hypothetical protein